MATALCPGAQNCIGTESPVLDPNISSEGPDVFKCFTHIFSPTFASACEFPLTFCNQMSALGINVSVFCDPTGTLPPTNPPAPVIYSSDARSCTVDCGDGTSETYEVAAGTFVGLSQAEANQRAFQFACMLAAMLCNGPLPELFTNTPQTCSDGCPDGTRGIYTTPAGFFTALSQAEADSEAFSFACVMAELLRSCNPPLDVTQGAGEPPPPGGSQPTYGNTTQSCTVACPNGSLYTHVVSSGTYTSESRAAANARAHALACQLANAQRVCLSDLDAQICNGVFFGEFLAATGLAQPVTFNLLAGSLPNGLVLGSDGFIQGVGSLVGDYAFTIRATGSDAHFVQRQYTMSVVGIDQVALPDGDAGEAYAEQLTATGFSSPTWAVTFGALPSGLSLSSTGLISGTPDTGEEASFTIEVSEGTVTCTKDFKITINSVSPTEWYKLDEAGPGPRVGSIAGTVLDDLFGATGSAAGKINLGADMISAGGSLLFYSVGSPALAYTGNGFDALGWINPAAFSSNPFDEFAGVGWQDADIGQYKFQALCEPWNGGHPVVVGPPMMKFNVRGDGASENIYYPVAFVPGTWIFWRVFYDPDTGRFGVQVNNGAIVLSSVHVFSAFTNGGWGIFNVGVAGSSFIMDETGIWMQKLSDAQASAVYNGGLGKTFP